MVTTHLKKRSPYEASDTLSILAIATYVIYSVLHKLSGWLLNSLPVTLFL